MPALEPLAALQQQLERRVAATRDLHAASSASLNLADSAPNLATHQRALPSTAAATAPARAKTLLSSKKPGYLRRCDTTNVTRVGAEVLVVGGSGRLVCHALSHVPSHCCNALMVLVASVLSDVFGICAVLCVI